MTRAANTRPARRLDGFAYCRLYAFRAGYEDVRQGIAPDYDAEAKHPRAYETGRAVAVYILASGHELRPVPRRSRFDGADLGWIVGWADRYHREAAQ